MPDSTQDPLGTERRRMQQRRYRRPGPQGPVRRQFDLFTLRSLCRFRSSFRAFWRGPLASRNHSAGPIVSTAASFLLQCMLIGGDGPGGRSRKRQHIRQNRPGMCQPEPGDKRLNRKKIEADGSAHGFFWGEKKIH